MTAAGGTQTTCFLMPWTQISLAVPDSLRDALTGELTEAGAVGILDEGQHFLAYFTEPVDKELILKLVNALFARSGLPFPAVSWETIHDQDWAEDWKKTWSSFPIGSRFFLIPSWLSPECPPDRFPIYLDPGQAFGTGTHETTQLTLEAMEQRLEPGQTVFDVGTGSGILAIAAALLGAGTVLGCDVDPVSIEVAVENCRRNNQENIGLMCGSVDAVAPDAVDLILCNLTADAIAGILRDAARILRAGAFAIFSGILTWQCADVKDALEKLGYSVLQETSRGEWSVLVSRKDGR